MFQDQPIKQDHQDFLGTLHQRFPITPPAHLCFGHTPGLSCHNREGYFNAMDIRYRMAETRQGNPSAEPTVYFDQEFAYTLGKPQPHHGGGFLNLILLGDYNYDRHDIGIGAITWDAVTAVAAIFFKIFEMVPDKTNVTLERERNGGRPDSPGTTLTTDDLLVMIRRHALAVTDDQGPLIFRDKDDPLYFLRPQAHDHPRNERMKSLLLSIYTSDRRTKDEKVHLYGLLYMASDMEQSLESLSDTLDKIIADSPGRPTYLYNAIAALLYHKQLLEKLTHKDNAHFRQN